MPASIVRAVSILRSSPTPEGDAARFQRPQAIGALAMVTHDRSRANPEVVLDRLISRRCQDPALTPRLLRATGDAE
jgi:hypothetical protein